MADKIFFASDFHFGIDVKYTSDEREKQVVEWLENIKGEAKAIYFLGDIFDYWFEYGTVVPKGFNRFLGKLKELRDLSISIYFFTGNHDMWMFDYFPDEFGIPIHKKPIRTNINGFEFFIGHGDGLGPGDWSYKFIKRIFSSRTCQWMFARIHPNFGINLMKFFSRRSRFSNSELDQYLGHDKEWLTQFSNKTIQNEKIDFFIFGHRHLPLDILLNNKKSRYINLGDWMNHNSFAVFDGKELELKFFNNDEGIVYKG